MESVLRQARVSEILPPARMPGVKLQRMAVWQTFPAGRKAHNWPEDVNPTHINFLHLPPDLSNLVLPRRSRLQHGEILLDTLQSVQVGSDLSAQAQLFCKKSENR